MENEGKKDNSVWNAARSFVIAYKKHGWHMPSCIIDDLIKSVEDENGAWRGQRDNLVSIGKTVSDAIGGHGPETVEECVKRLVARYQEVLASASDAARTYASQQADLDAIAQLVADYHSTEHDTIPGSVGRVVQALVEAKAQTARISGYRDEACSARDELARRLDGIRARARTTGRQPWPGNLASAEECVLRLVKEYEDVAMREEAALRGTDEIRSTYEAQEKRIRACIPADVASADDSIDVAMTYVSRQLHERKRQLETITELVANLATEFHFDLGTTHPVTAVKRLCERVEAMSASTPKDTNAAKLDAWIDVLDTRLTEQAAALVNIKADISSIAGMNVNRDSEIASLNRVAQAHQDEINRITRHLNERADREREDQKHVGEIQPGERVVIVAALQARFAKAVGVLRMSISDGFIVDVQTGNDVMQVLAVEIRRR